MSILTNSQKDDNPIVSLEYGGTTVALLPKFDNGMINIQELLQLTTKALFTAIGTSFGICQKLLNLDAVDAKPYPNGPPFLGCFESAMYITSGGYERCATPSRRFSRRRPTKMHRARRTRRCVTHADQTETGNRSCYPACRLGHASTNFFL